MAANETAIGSVAPVPYDPELVDGLAAFLDLVEIIPLRADTILANRAHFATIIPRWRRRPRAGP